MDYKVNKIEYVIESLITDVKTRNRCLSVFGESLREANTYGANKWGVYHNADNARLRLLIGNLIILTFNKQGLWMPLDQQSLQESKKELDFLNLSKDWHWDTGRWSEYMRIPSKNGYYMPAENHPQIWPIIRRLYFEYIGKVAKKFLRLRQDTQKKHMPQVLAYLRQTLGQYIPDPIYGDSVDLNPNPIREIQEFTYQYQNLSKTVRESVVQSRIGQGKFRTELIQYWKGCAVTNCQTLEVLRASHIKPWRNSNNKERLDVYNGLLLSPTLDAVFDNGLISFADNGKIITSGFLPENDRLKLKIDTDMRIARVEQQHLDYLKYHRVHVFKKSV